MRSLPSVLHDDDEALAAALRRDSEFEANLPLRMTLEELEFPSGISIRVAICGNEWNQNCSFLSSIYSQSFQCFGNGFCGFFHFKVSIEP